MLVTVGTGHRVHVRRASLDHARPQLVQRRGAHFGMLGVAQDLHRVYRAACGGDLHPEGAAQTFPNAYGLPR